MILPESRGGVAHGLENRSGLTLMQSRSKTRLEKRDDKRVIRGYAAVFYREEERAGTEYWLWNDMVERIMPGAFDRAIKEAHDARALFNHDGNWLLGRVASETARLSVDSVGLIYEVDEDRNDPQWQSVAAKVDRGDITGSSFAFIAKRTVWIETDEYYVRQIEDVDLYDVSPVTWPAYSGTTAGRNDCRGSVPSHVLQLIQERQLSQLEKDSVNIRTTLAALGV